MTDESRGIDQQFLPNDGPAVVEETLLTGQKKKNLASVIRTMTSVRHAGLAALQRKPAPRLSPPG
jgi:hypothetical protein